MNILSAAEQIAITRLLYQSFWLIDNGRASEVADCFAANGSLTFGPSAPKPGTLEGEQIAQAMAARQAQSQVTSRHVLSNVLVEPLGSDRAKLRALLTLFRTESDQLVPDIASVADIEDTVIRCDGEWKIAERLILPVFNR